MLWPAASCPLRDPAARKIDAHRGAQLLLRIEVDDRRLHADRARLPEPAGFRVPAAPLIVDKVGQAGIVGQEPNRLAVRPRKARECAPFMDDEPRRRKWLRRGSPGRCGTSAVVHVEEESAGGSGQGNDYGNRGKKISHRISPVIDRARPRRRAGEPTAPRHRQIPSGWHALKISACSSNTLL
jgi:hypothetical protein